MKVALGHCTLWTERTRLYLAALKGDWNSIEGMPRIQRCIGIKGETTLHIAAAAKQEEFVNKLLKWIKDNNLMTAENVSLTARNEIGATALNFTAAVGNVEIAKAMLLRDTNGDLPNIATTGENPMKPILMAASSGHNKMYQIICSEALQMLEANSNLARAESNGETALHVLARKTSAFVNERLKFKQENSKQSVANDLFTECLMAYKRDVEHLIETPEIPQALFDAARVGNIEFMVKLIRFDFDILWTTDNKKSIFHVAVEERHESIFNLLHELGSFGEIIVERRFENRSNILHLAARLAPQEKLNAISGAALQMQREFLWFKVRTYSYALSRKC
ncbi:ankyrin-3 [Quercus suber]|uniref:Ankyrin-3 n=1 Tax=Quercus suber TaxID=58331 RepID=A0AAW0K167_QUESU